MVDNEEKQLRPLLVSFCYFLFQLFRKVAFKPLFSSSISSVEAFLLQAHQKIAAKGIEP